MIVVVAFVWSRWSRGSGAVRPTNAAPRLPVTTADGSPQPESPEPKTPIVALGGATSYDLGPDSCPRPAHPAHVLRPLPIDLLALGCVVQPVQGNRDALRACLPERIRVGLLRLRHPRVDLHAHGTLLGRPAAAEQPLDQGERPLLCFRSASKLGEGYVTRHFAPVTFTYDIRETDLPTATGRIAGNDERPLLGRARVCECPYGRSAGSG
jgi:hypothetical protein